MANRVSATARNRVTSRDVMRLILCGLSAVVAACATGARTPATEAISLGVSHVPVPVRPDSAWAVQTAILIFSGGDSTHVFRVVDYCVAPNGYFVAVVPMPLAGRLFAIGGGVVFIALSGRATILEEYH